MQKQGMYFYLLKTKAFHVIVNLKLNGESNLRPFYFETNNVFIMLIRQINKKVFSC
jgi:hypothetical protein